MDKEGVGLEKWTIFMDVILVSSLILFEIWDWKISNNYFSIYQWSRNANKFFTYFILTICHNHVSGNSVLVFVAVSCFLLLDKTVFIAVFKFCIPHPFPHIHLIAKCFVFSIILILNFRTPLTRWNFSGLRNAFWTGKNSGNCYEYYNELEGEKTKSLIEELSEPNIRISFEK